MKATYIIAILVALLLITACKKEVVPEAEVAVEEPVVNEPEAVVVEPTVEADAPAAASEGLSYESVDERAQRLIDACKAGNVGLCAALKTQYGIDMSPASTEEKQEAISEEMAEDSELGE